MVSNDLWTMRIGGPCRECGGSRMMHYSKCQYATIRNTITFKLPQDLIDSINKALSKAKEGK